MEKTRRGEQERKRGSMAEWLRTVFVKSRWLTALALLLVLWTAVGIRFALTRTESEEALLLTAFTAAGEPYIEEGRLEITAYYGDRYLGTDERRELLLSLAQDFGLEPQEGVTEAESAGRETISVHRQARYADTTITLVSMEKENSMLMQHYILLSLKIYGDNQESLIHYRTRFIEALESCAVTQYSATMQLVGRLSGNLSVAERNRLADEMLAQLNCAIVAENRAEAQYTVYGYSKEVAEYIVSDGKKINVQTAFTYDESRNETRVYLATPLISGGW